MPPLVHFPSPHGPGFPSQNSPTVILNMVEAPDLLDSRVGGVRHLTTLIPTLKNCLKNNQLYGHHFGRCRTKVGFSTDRLV